MARTQRPSGGHRGRQQRERRAAALLRPRAGHARPAALCQRQAQLLRRRRHCAPPGRADRRADRTRWTRHRPAWLVRVAGAGARPVAARPLRARDGAAARGRQLGRPGDRSLPQRPGPHRAHTGARAAAVGRARRSRARLRRGASAAAPRRAVGAGRGLARGTVGGRARRARTAVPRPRDTFLAAGGATVQRRGSAARPARDRARRAHEPAAAGGRRRCTAGRSRGRRLRASGRAGRAAQPRAATRTPADLPRHGLAARLRRLPAHRPAGRRLRA